MLCFSAGVAIPALYQRKPTAHRRLAAAVALALACVAAPAHADPPTPAAPDAAPVRYFYFGRDYGSQAMYGPLWVFLNRGFDVLQDHIAPRQIFSFDYRTNTGNVLRNVAHPFPAIADRRMGDVPERGDLPAQLHARRRPAGRPTTACT